ncbi:hypothetical protein LJC46_04965 [Desulfovibrio sp. OttesenSCG-928-G15]|nr:hypothetical protein [Desulfovibrio sp. OttesenSCG-928-G15]
MRNAFVRFHIICIALLVSGLCANAEQPSATLPARTVFTAPPTSSGVRQNLPKAVPNDPAIKAKAARPNKASLLPGEVEKNFSADPFGMTHRSKSKDKRPLRYTPQPQDHTSPAGQKDGKAVEFRAGAHDAASKDRLTPRRSTVFSGGEHTKPYLDSEQNSPEVEVRFKKDNEPVATRLVVNPQDPNSPLYRPAAKENMVNAAGVYMDIDLNPDMQMQVGGEVGSVDNKAAEEKATSGAAVNLKWQF